MYDYNGMHTAERGVYAISEVSTETEPNAVRGSSRGELPHVRMRPLIMQKIPTPGTVQANDELGTL